ncbi:5138_t:CDS:1, partial [Racocetra fulgida]
YLCQLFLQYSLALSSIQSEPSSDSTSGILFLSNSPPGSNNCTSILLSAFV